MASISLCNIVLNLKKNLPRIRKDTHGVRFECALQVVEILRTFRNLIIENREVKLSFFRTLHLKKKKKTKGQFFILSI